MVHPMFFLVSCKLAQSVKVREAQDRVQTSIRDEQKEKRERERPDQMSYAVHPCFISYTRGTSLFTDET